MVTPSLAFGWRINLLLCTLQNPYTANARIIRDDEAVNSSNKLHLYSWMHVGVSIHRHLVMNLIKFDIQINNVGGIWKQIQKIHFLYKKKRLTPKQCIHIFICVRFITTPLNVVDLMSILPTWLTLAFKDNEAMYGTAKVLRVCRPPSFLSPASSNLNFAEQSHIYDLVCYCTSDYMCERVNPADTRTLELLTHPPSLSPSSSTPVITNMRAPQVLRIMRIFKLARHNAGLLVKFIFRLA